MRLTKQQQDKYLAMIPKLVKEVEELKAELKKKQTRQSKSEAK